MAYIVSRTSPKFRIINNEFALADHPAVQLFPSSWEIVNSIPENCGEMIFELSDIKLLDTWYAEVPVGERVSNLQVLGNVKTALAMNDKEMAEVFSNEFNFETQEGQDFLRKVQIFIPNFVYRE